MPEDKFLVSQCALFGLKVDDVKPQDLVVPRGEKHIISRTDPKIQGMKWIPNVGRTLKPKSFADIKKWIGVPDTVAKRLPPTAVRHPVSGIARPGAGRPGRVMEPEARPDLMAVAKNYLLGVSTEQEHSLEILDELIADIGIYIPFFKDVTIEHDATLVIARDVKNFNARNIIIKTGGRLSSMSDMVHINCNSMTGNVA